MGCRLRAIKKDGAYTAYTIEGYSCKRGLEYGLQEMKYPRRNISSTVYVKNGFLAALPVKTAAPIPKGMIFQVMEEINKITVTAPVKTGAVIAFLIVRGIVICPFDVTLANSILRLLTFLTHNITYEFLKSKKYLRTCQL